MQQFWLVVGSGRNWKVAFENSNPICHKLFLISNSVSRVSCIFSNPHLLKFSIRLVRMVPDEICKTEITAHPVELLDWAYYSNWKARGWITTKSRCRGERGTIEHCTLYVCYLIAGLTKFTADWKWRRGWSWGRCWCRSWWRLTLSK